MKRENIENSKKSTVISTFLNIAVRLGIVCFFIANMPVASENMFLHITSCVIILVLILQSLFLPYITWVRLKEIKKGENYEASKY